MRRGAVGAFASVLVACCVAGCGHRGVPQPPKAAQNRAALLPSWAPEHPSPEFLHAAKLLKAIPQEAEPYRPEFVPCWELFGSLTDQQIAQLMTWRYESRSNASKDLVDVMVGNGQGRVEGDRLVMAFRSVSIPMKSFSPRQWQLYDEYAAVYGGTDQGPGKHDLLVDLYHAGAKQDLSNVELYFVGVGHLVTMSFAGRDRPFPMIGSGMFAQLRESPPFAQSRRSAAPQSREKPRARSGRAE
jgi:hypothetical protein